jgi:hypothetical protein
LWIAVLVILLGAAIMAATLARSSLAPTGSRRVTFRVESTGGYANITIKAGSFHIDDPQTMTTPWEKTVDVARAESVFLTAANPTQTGQLTCKIYLDHQIWKTETIPAPKDGVACAGIIP